MGFFDFIKKAIGEAEKKVEIAENKPKKELTLPEIKDKIEKDEKEILQGNEKLGQKAKFLVNETIPLLREGLTGLKTVNLDKRKEDAKLKSVVMENVSSYSYYLEKLINELECSENLTEISKIFENFTKNSAKSYERATILVGKEFEAISEVLKNFVREFNPIIKEYHENNLKMHKFKKINERFEEINEVKDAENEVKSNILKLKAEKKEKDKEINDKRQEMKKIIESSDYILDLKNKESKKNEIKILEKEMNDVVHKIDLKELARIYHESEKKHKIIQNYAGNLKKAIEEDKENAFSEIVKESKGIEVNFTGINEKIKELEGFMGESELKLKEIEGEIERLMKKIREIEFNISEDEKKITRFNSKIQEIEKNLREIENV